MRPSDLNENLEQAINEIILGTCYTVNAFVYPKLIRPMKEPTAKRFLSETEKYTAELQLKITI